MILRNEQIVETVFSFNQRIEVLENLEFLTRDHDIRNGFLLEEVSDFVDQDLYWVV